MNQESAVFQAAECQYDLVVLDVMLPDINGISLCKQMRSGGYEMPILLLTARNTSIDKVKGLDAGADDYMVKPESKAEVASSKKKKSEHIAAIAEVWEQFKEVMNDRLAILEKGATALRKGKLSDRLLHSAREEYSLGKS